jgi:hypothetical protein
MTSTVRDEKMWEESRGEPRLVVDLLVLHGREHHLSDQENIKPDEENDVEAHRKKSVMANEGEVQDDSKDDDDVELHGRGRRLL